MPTHRYIGEYRAVVKKTKAGEQLRIHSSIYKNAYIYSRGEVWYTRVYHNGREHRKTTPYIADPPNIHTIEQSLELLHERYEILLGIRNEESHIASLGEVNISDIIEGYMEIYGEQLSAHSKRHHSRSIKALLPMNMEATEDNIYYMVSNALKSPTRSYKTNQKMLPYINKICDWAVSRKMLNGNPIPSIQKNMPAPSKRQQSKNSREMPKPQVMEKVSELLRVDYNTIKELYKENNVREYLQKNSTVTQSEKDWLFWSRFIAILDHTAMRPIELVRLKISDIGEEGFQVDGKNGTRPFYFNNKYFPDLRDIIDTQIFTVSKSFKDPKLFQGIKVATRRGIEEPALHTPNKVFKTLQAIAGQREKFFSLYTIRANTLNRWRNIFMLPRELIDMIGDNSEKMRQQHYNAPDTVTDVKRWFDNM